MISDENSNVFQKSSQDKKKIVLVMMKYSFSSDNVNIYSLIYLQ